MPLALSSRIFLSTTYQNCCLSAPFARHLTTSTPVALTASSAADMEAYCEVKTPKVMISSEMDRKMATIEQGAVDKSNGNGTMRFFCWQLTKREWIAAVAILVVFTTVLVWLLYWLTCVTLFLSEDTQF